MTSTTAPKTPAQREDNALMLQSEFTTIVREETGMNETFASMVAAAIVRGMRRQYGGQQLYVPCVDKTERNAAIRREFHGTNAGEICRRYDISRPRLYEILKGQ